MKHVARIGMKTNSYKILVGNVIIGDGLEESVESAKILLKVCMTRYWIKCKWGMDR